MNERIPQLARQADAMAREIVTDLREIPIYNKIRDEKFAELIVKECLKLNSKELSITAIERLLPLYREHFGVEE
jgi:hypothetical protein